MAASSLSLEAQYERNVRTAQDGTEAWLKVSELEASVPRKALKLLLSDYTEEQQKHLRVRKIEDTKPSCASLTPFGANYKVLQAIRHDGTHVKVTYPDPNEPVVGYFIVPTHETGLALRVADQFVVKEDEYLAFCVANGIKEITVARMPRLKEDRTTDLCSEYIPEEHLEKPSLCAERKERQCAACGVVWRKTMTRCGKCKKVRFCSKACQTKLWPEHKLVCVESETVN